MGAFRHVIWSHFSYGSIDDVTLLDMHGGFGVTDVYFKAEIANLIP